MRIGKQDAPYTAICTSDADSITVRAMPVQNLFRAKAQRREGPGEAGKAGLTRRHEDAGQNVEPGTPSSCLRVFV